MTARDIVMSAAGNSGDSKTYIEDVFSTYLYTGNGATQTINNGIDLAGKGGMVWTKSRQYNADNELYDTARGAYNVLRSNSTSAQSNFGTYGLTAFNSNGFSVADLSNGSYGINGSPGGTYAGTNALYASWTFRKAPKFFDVVTYTGNGVAGRTISHSLGQAPGMIIVKKTNSTGGWATYHRGVGATKALELQITAAAFDAPSYWNNTSPTSTVFTVGSDTYVNGSGNTYVAYLFAHDTTTDGLIQCGSFTGTGAVGNNVTLGWEPQYILVKRTDSSGSWVLQDSMRSMSQTNLEYLLADTSGSAQNDGVGYLIPNATGFSLNTALAPWNASGGTYIYMAIRRGPMRTPTDGTKVFEPQVYTANNTTSRTFTNSGGFVTDAVLTKNRSANDGVWMINRLVGNEVLRPWTTEAGNSSYSGLSFAVQNGYSNSTSSESNYYWNDSSRSNVQYYFKRASGFFDVVCYTGTGVARTINHNLGVAPELMIVKSRSLTENWTVYNKTLTATKYLYLNSSMASDTFAGWWNNTEPTSNTFSLGTGAGVNGSGANYVAYLFASCPGVSKVFSFTGNGSSQTINCGFTNGARLVLIKRTDSTGDWYVWDTARGIVAANDPHLSLNTYAAEVTTDDTIDPASTGFIINQVSATNVNVNGASYIGLAIA